MTGAYWAWASDGSAMHAWRLTVSAVQLAKSAGTEHETVCGRTLGIGERPTQPPRAQAEHNHCPACWMTLNPRPIDDPFLPALVLPDIPDVETQWRRSS